MLSIPKEKKITKNCSITNARQEAKDCFMNRDFNTFMSVLINSKYPYYRKRHFIVYKNPSTDSQTKESVIGLTLHFEEMQIPLLNNVTGNITSVEAKIIEKVEFRGQLWLYIHTERAVNTYTVCKALALACNFNENGFFTDELPVQRAQLKRYDYIKIQMFKMCLNIMRQNPSLENVDIE